MASVASLIWPELLAAVVTLAVLATFVVWVRALRVVRDRRTTRYRPRRLIPLLGLGISGWSVAALVGSFLPEARVLVLGGVAIGFWFLAPAAGVEG